MLRVRLVSSELRSLCFFILGWLGALPSNMPRHAQLRCHSLARGVHRKVLCQNGLLRDGLLTPWHPGQLSWAYSKIFPSTQTEQNLRYFTKFGAISQTFNLFPAPPLACAKVSCRWA